MMTAPSSKREIYVNTDDPEQIRWWKTNQWPVDMSEKLKIVLCHAMAARWENERIESETHDRR